MADQGRWFKLWCSALTDEKLQGLPLDDFARWTMLGMYVKMHGTNGKITLRSPSRLLVALLQLDGFKGLIDLVKTLPNVVLERHVTEDVTGNNNTPEEYSLRFRKWVKYQGDVSRDRVAKHRKSKSVTPDVTPVTPKKRREEKRREETPPTPQDGFDDWWKKYPRKVAKEKARSIWMKMNPAREHVGRMIMALRNHCESQEWAKDDGEYIPHPTTWLNQKRWTDVLKPAKKKRDTGVNL